MYQNPTLFPAISNREGWSQLVQIWDDAAGTPIALTDANNNPLYSLTLEISPAAPGDHGYGFGAYPFYDGACDAPTISATLADYLSIVDVGAIQIAIPKSKIIALRPQTYDVYLTIDPNNADDGRQILIGRLPVLYGGRNT